MKSHEDSSVEKSIAVLLLPYLFVLFEQLLKRTYYARLSWKVSLTLGEGLYKRHGKAFLVAAAKGEEKILKLLLANGANINDANGSAGSALYSAAGKGQLEVVKLLLKNRANVNLRSGYSAYVLQVAASKGHAKIVPLLLKKMVLK